MHEDVTTQQDLEISNDHFLAYPCTFIIFQLLYGLVLLIVSYCKDR